MLQHCSLYQVLLLAAMVLHMNAIGVDFVLVTDVYARMTPLVARHAKRDLLFPEFQAVAASLASVGIISIVPPSTKVATGAGGGVVRHNAEARDPAGRRVLRAEGQRGGEGGAEPANVTIRSVCETHAMGRVLLPLLFFSL